MSQIATSSWPATFKVKKIDLRICEIRRKRTISSKKATWGQKFWLQVEVNLSHVQILHITFSLMILNLSNSREKLSQILRQFNLNYGIVVKISEEKGNLHFLQIATLNTNLEVTKRDFKLGRGQLVQKLHRFLFGTYGLIQCRLPGKYLSSGINRSCWTVTWRRSTGWKRSVSMRLLGEIQGNSLKDFVFNSKKTNF